MAILELLRPAPDWFAGLTVALTRPAGVPERRRGREDPWKPAAASRPRRVSDDLAWLRQAVDQPLEHGLELVEGTPRSAIWHSNGPAAYERLVRLRARGVLDAAGFMLHEPDLPESA